LCVLGQERERRYLAIVESAVDFAIIATDASGNITEWNSGAEKVLGWTADEICGAPLDRFFTPEDRAADRPAIEMRLALAEGHAADERWHLKKDGNRFWANGEMMPIQDDEGLHLGFVKILRDRTEQRDAAAAHQADAEFLRSVLASSGDCIKVLDLDGRLTFMSEGGMGVMEVSDFNAVKGCPWPNFWEQDGNVQAKEALDAARAGKASRFQGDAATFKGNWKSWDVQVTPILAEDGQPSRILAVSRDITENRRADRLRFGLADLGDRLRAITDVEAMQAAASEVIGKVLGVDRVGYGSMEEDGETFTVPSDWTVPDCPSLAGTYRIDDYGLYAADLRAGSTVIIDDIRVDPRTSPNPEPLAKVWVGSLINHPVMEHGRIAAILFVNSKSAREWRADEIDFVREAADRLRQASERRRAELELSELNCKLESEVEARTADRNRLWAMSADIMLVAGLDGTIHAVNPAWEAVLGWTDEELVGTSLFDLIHPDDLAHTVAGASAISDGKTLLRFENRYRQKDDGYRYISWTAGPGDGLIIAVGRDITVEREQAEALAEAEEQLRQSQKMEAVGQLTGGLAHDFNNLLTGITGSLEMIGIRIAQGRMGDVEKYSAAAQGAAKRAAALTHRLLAFSRRQTLDPKPTSPNQLIEGMLELIRRTMGPSVETRFVPGPSLWNTLVDPSQLDNALLNLCINARDAMPGGGRLMIETSNVVLDQRAARIRELKAGSYISLCVVDTGTGMAPDVIAKAFEPFYTTKPLGVGTGLGLSMIYGFARQSNGSVHIESSVGEGTKVCIYLPRYGGGAEREVAPADLSDAPRAENGETVLVVDDEPSVRMLVTDVLEELGYLAIEAGDGAAGLKVLQSDVRVDLLVSDVGLPGGMNGRQMADVARVVRPDLKILFITGYAENAVVDGGNLDPGMHVMTKPFAMEALATRIRSLIEGR
jgi:PAS domain S-box-containing protein